MKPARGLSVERDEPKPELKTDHINRDEVHSEGFEQGSPTHVEESATSLSSPKSSLPATEMNIKDQDRGEARGEHKVGGAEDGGRGGQEGREIAIKEEEDRGEHKVGGAEDGGREGQEGREIAIKEEEEDGSLRSTLTINTRQGAPQAIEGQAIQEGVVTDNQPAATPLTTSEPALAVPRKVFRPSLRMRCKKTCPPTNQTAEWRAANTILFPYFDWNRGAPEPRP